MRCYALRDDQWERIKDILPGRFVPVPSGNCLERLTRTFWRFSSDSPTPFSLESQRCLKKCFRDIGARCGQRVQDD